jgi:hypothetical protein
MMCALNVHSDHRTDRPLIQFHLDTFTPAGSSTKTGLPFAISKRVASDPQTFG